MGELGLEMAVKRRPQPQSQAFELFILQIPKDCRITGKSDTGKPARASKWPLDPAPVVEFKLQDGDVSRSYLHSPFWFCSAALEHLSGPMDTASSLLAGCLVSSLHKVKLQDNMGEHGLFIFGDLHAKMTGDFRLRFTLYELRSNADSTYVATLASKLSEPFKIHSGKSWPGQAESTPLSRHLCESGVKLRIRKETSKRKAQSQDWSSCKRAAISSLALPMPMGPPPINRRFMTGEDINPDQVQFTGGLGIKDALDREQGKNSHNYVRSSYTGFGDYRAQADARSSLSGSYLRKSNLAFDSRSPGPYNSTSDASPQYMAAQSRYGSDVNQYSRNTALPSSLDIQRTSGINEQPYSGGLHAGFSLDTSRHGSSYTDSPIRSDMNRYSTTNTLSTPSSVYAGRSTHTEPSTRYDDARSDRSILLSEPSGIPSSHIPSWPPMSLSLSNIDLPRPS